SPPPSPVCLELGGVSDSFCSHLERISAITLTCCGPHQSLFAAPVDAHLVNGDRRCSGHVEMKHRGQWRTLKVSPSHRSSRTVGFVELACRQMGCGSATSVKFLLNTMDHKPAWEVHFSCQGSDRTIQHGKKLCGRCVLKQDTSPTLSSINAIMLVNGGNRCAGWVQVKYGGMWHHLCHDDFTLIHGFIGCRDMGCGFPQNLPPSNIRQSVKDTLNISCSGHEQRLTDCRISSTPAESSSAECKPAFLMSSYVRLMGAKSRCLGSLELEHRGEWRPVSQQLWGLKEAAVVCRQLGCGSVLHTHTQSSVNELQPVWSFYSDCEGSEGALLSCGSVREGMSASTVHVLCSGTGNMLLKQKGASQMKVTAESSGWDLKHASIVCRQLGCGEAVSTSKIHLQTFESMWRFFSNCAGPEEALLNCGHIDEWFSHTCYGHRDKKGTQNCSGFVQVKSNGSWMDICESTFTEKNGFVACRELGCGFLLRFFSEDTDSDSIRSEFQCSGLEEHLRDCPSTPLDTGTTCRSIFLVCGGQYEIIKTRETAFWIFFFLQKSQLPQRSLFTPSSHQMCTWAIPMWSNAMSMLHIKFSSYVRLVGTKSRCLGTLELEHMQNWRPVSQQMWGLKEAAVVCRQLGCGSVLHTHTQSSVNERQPVWSFYSDCEGSEGALLSCGSVREGMSASTVHVFCSGESHTGAHLRTPCSSSAPTLSILTAQCLRSILAAILVWSSLETKPITLRTKQLSITRPSSGLIRLKNPTPGSTAASITTLCLDTTSPLKFICFLLLDAEDIVLDDGLVQDTGRTVCSGRLFVKEGGSQMMIAAENNNWDMRHASIVCRQLGCGNAVSTSKIKLPKVIPMWSFFSDCDGAEAALLQCGVRRFGGVNNGGDRDADGTDSSSRVTENTSSVLRQKRQRFICVVRFYICFCKINAIYKEQSIQ
uniref:SRCR domain-containing protein n=1 Tax=Periophthalmus magnuspinnatus TaxID=409849 RepID=A0A3B3ZEL9_9GOBI